MDRVILQLPAKADFLLTARLTASSIGSRAGFSIDQVEDLKTAVSEACHIIMYQGRFASLTIAFDLSGSKLGVSVDGADSGGVKPSVEADLEMSQYILDAMTDDLNILTDNSGVIYEINFTIDAGGEEF